MCKISEIISSTLTLLKFNCSPYTLKNDGWKTILSYWVLVTVQGRAGINSRRGFLFIDFFICVICDPVGGRNPAPPGMYETLQMTGYLPYQLVQDFFHQPHVFVLHLFMCLLNTVAPPYRASLKSHYSCNVFSFFPLFIFLTTLLSSCLLGCLPRSIFKLKNQHTFPTPPKKISTPYRATVANKTYMDLQT